MYITEPQLMQVLKMIFAITIAFDFACIVWVASFIFQFEKIPRKLITLYCILFGSILLFEISLWVEFFLPTPKYTWLVIDQISFASGFTTAFFILYFIWHIAEKQFLHKWFLRGIFGLSLFFVIVTFIPGAIIGERTYLSDNLYHYNIQTGPFMPWYYYAVLLIFFVTIIIFIRAFRAAIGLQKIRLTYIGFSLMTIFTIGVGSSVFLPLYYFFTTGNFDSAGEVQTVIAQVVSGIGMSIFSVASAYAITRYRFMDIKVVLKKSFVYGGVLVVLFGFFFAVTFWLYSISDSLLWFGTAFLAVVLFGERVKQRIRMVLDNIFFLEELDLSKKMSERSAQLDSVKEIHGFIDEFNTALPEIVPGVQVIQLFAQQRQHNRLNQYFPNEQKKTISYDDPAMQIIQHEDADTVYVVAELEANPNAENAVLLQFLRKYSAGALCVLRSRKGLHGIALVSDKNDDRLFTIQDGKKLSEYLQIAGNNLGVVVFWYETVEGLKRKFHEDEY